jgi:hypothetical protein
LEPGWNWDMPNENTILRITFPKAIEDQLKDHYQRVSDQESKSILTPYLQSIRDEITEVIKSAVHGIYDDLKRTKLFDDNRSYNLSSIDIRGQCPEIDKEWRLFIVRLCGILARPTGYSILRSYQNIFRPKLESNLRHFIINMLNDYDPLAGEYLTLLKKKTPTKLAEKYTSNIMRYLGFSRGKGRRGSIPTATSSVRFIGILSSGKIEVTDIIEETVKNLP